MSVDIDEALRRANEDTELKRENLSEFLDSCFENMVEVYGTDADNFQGLGSVAGSMFEMYFEEVIEELYEIEVEVDVPFPDICMKRAGAADAVLKIDGEIAAVVEVKGCPEVYRMPDGEVVSEPSQPGLERSDTVKKAVCQAYQAKSKFDDKPFFIAANIMPKEGSSSHCILSLAEGDIIDKVVDVTDPEEIDEMIEMTKDSV